MSANEMQNVLVEQLNLFHLALGSLSPESVSVLPVT